MERQQKTFDPTRVVWCTTHESFTGRDCLGPDCVVKETQLAEVEEGGS